MITVGASALDKAGRKLLRLTRTLYTLPVADGLAGARDLTTIPAVRLSRVLEPFCRNTRSVEHRHAHDEPVRQSDWGMLSREPVRATPAFADAVRIEKRSDGAAATERPQHETSRHVDVPRADVAPVLRAMKVLNVSVQRRPLATGRPSGQPSVRYQAKRSGFIRGLGEATPERDRTTTAGRDEGASVGGGTRANEARGPSQPADDSKPVAPGSDRVSRTRGTSVRMAQGVSGIAALLQANVAAIGRAGSELPREPDITLDKESDETAGPGFVEDPRSAAASQVDMEHIADRLADHLELELIRTYGAPLK